jgi:GTP-binding protein
MSNNVIFGPIISRRLGRSLGIDLIPYKTCTLDCIYCECGKTTNKTLKRQDFISPDIILSELKKALMENTNIDVITFSGSGEPTLYKSLDYLIDEIKKITDIPLVMITNSTLLTIDEVKKALLKVDFVLPSLDASCFSTFRKINIPHKELSFNDILNALIDFSHEYKGKIWLEILFCAGINDTEEEIQEFEKIIPKIRTDMIQINSVDRPPAYSIASSPKHSKLEEIAKRLNGTVVARKKLEDNNSDNRTNVKTDKKRILEFLRRRPETIEALQNGLSIQNVYLIKLLSELEDSNKIKKVKHGNNWFYKISD